LGNNKHFAGMKKLHDHTMCIIFAEKIQSDIYDYASVLLCIETTGLKCKLEILLIKHMCESLKGWPALSSW
jgi:hypothetical protein